MNRAGLLREIDRLESRVAGLEELVEDVAEAHVTQAHVRDAEAFHEEPEAFEALIPLLVGFDPSLGCSGAAGVTLDGNLTPVIASAIPSSPKVKRGDYFLHRQLDDMKRARGVFQWAYDLLDLPPKGYRIVAVALETPSGIPTSFAKRKPGDPPRPKGWRPPQDAQAFGKMVRAGQAVYDAARAGFDGSPVVVSTYGAKEAATGSKRPKGKKKEVEASVRRLFGPTELDTLLRGIRGGADGREAFYDALAVVLAALDAVPVRAAIEEWTRAQEDARVEMA